MCVFVLHGDRRAVGVYDLTFPSSNGVSSNGLCSDGLSDEFPRAGEGEEEKGGGESEPSEEEEGEGEEGQAARIVQSAWRAYVRSQRPPEEVEKADNARKAEEEGLMAEMEGVVEEARRIVSRAGGAGGRR